MIDKGVDILIATPGRLLDHFERGRLLLTGVQIMVVDEADRMLDMGFIPDIEKIFRLTPFTRQTLFFSATMAPEIERVTDEFLQNPARVEVAPQATTSENTAQSVCAFKAGRKYRAAKEKRIVLRSLISGQGEKLTNGIVFCNRKTDVDIVAKSLKVHGFDAKPIHGDLDQSHRTRVLDEFRQGQVKLLVASDVAARGLDIPNVSHIFNYDVPNNVENYVHRIGRTGRAGRTGSAFTICLSPADDAAFAAVEELINLKVSRIELPDSAREEISRLDGSKKGAKDEQETEVPKHTDETGAGEVKRSGIRIPVRPRSGPPGVPDACSRSREAGTCTGHGPTYTGIHEKAVRTEPSQPPVWPGALTSPAAPGPARRGS